MSTSVPKIAFVTPVSPMAGGSGLAMRAGATYRALAKRAQLHVVVPSSTFPSTRLRRFTRDHLNVWYRHLYSRPVDWAEPGSGACRAAANAVARESPDRVHVFRHYLAPIAETFHRRLPCQLDLDESEARTRMSLASLARGNGDRVRAEAWESEAKFFADGELRTLPAFDTVFVCSDLERDYLLDRMPELPVRVLPNTISIPEVSSPLQRGAGPFTFFFVGSLGYYPNEDAARYLIREVLPILRACLTADFRVVIAGGNASRDLRRILSGTPGVEALGYVPRLDDHYRAADAVLIPVRGGGGTRIKALEAFAYQRPVVSTRAGIEGLPVVADEHLLIGDSAEEFAHACVRLANSSALASSITRQAFDLIREKFTEEVLESSLF